MSKEKQIEEMAKIIGIPCYKRLEAYGDGSQDCPSPLPCNECTAALLYNAGYRKQSIIYRPHRSTLSEAMSEKQEFSSLKQMFVYLVNEHENAFNVEDIFISYYCYDERISWETYIVTVTRYGDEKYDHPQAIGFCTMKGGAE